MNAHSRSRLSGRWLARHAGVLGLSGGVHAGLWLLLGYLQPESQPEPPVVLTPVDVLVEPMVEPVPQVVTEGTAVQSPAPASVPEPVRVTRAPRPSSAPASPPDYGVELGNDGPAAAPAGDGPVRTDRARAPTRTRALSPTCAEAEVKPRPLALPQPQYTEAARAAGISGKVRVQLSVDADGVVGTTKVVSSLDPGLDAAALAAVKSARFAPATRCGAPVAATLTIAVTFTL